MLQEDFLSQKQKGRGWAEDSIFTKDSKLNAIMITQLNPVFKINPEDPVFVASLCKDSHEYLAISAFLHG